MFYHHYSTSAKNHNLAERRLIMRQAAPDARQVENPENNNTGTQRESQTVDAARQQTQNRVRSVAGNEMRGVQGIPGWKPLPRPNTRAVATTALVAGAVAMPPVAAAAATGYVGWKTLSKLPGFRQVNSVGRSITRTVGSIGGNIAQTAAYPFRLGGRLGMNVLRVGTEGVGAVARNTIGRPYESLMRGVNTRVNNGENIGMIGTCVVAAKRAWSSSWSGIGKIFKGLTDGLDNHPIRTVAGAMLAYAALTNWSGVLAGSKQLVQAIIKAIARFGA